MGLIFKCKPLTQKIVHADIKNLYHFPVLFKMLK
jgi:hypothetical protein